jgi:hypothetical protein
MSAFKHRARGFVGVNDGTVLPDKHDAGRKRVQRAFEGIRLHRFQVDEIGNDHRPAQMRG